jgi:hypothetical protein
MKRYEAKQTLYVDNPWGTDFDNCHNRSEVMLLVPFNGDRS